MAIRIISAEERMQSSGIKGVIFGKSGCGKTSLLWTLDPATTLFVDMEAGGLSVQGWAGDSVEVRDWITACNLACWIGGPNPSVKPGTVFSAEHYAYVCGEYGDPAALDKYKTIFIDSITVLGRLCFAWAQQQPEAFSEKTGKPDTRGAYGLHGRTMMSWLTHMQHVKGKNVWFVGILDHKQDDFKRWFWQPQIEGSKTGLELPGIVDQVITMAEMTPENADPYRAFVCHTLNPWQFPAKDRSGTLEMIEPPHLGELMAKIARGQRKPVADYSYSIPTPQTSQEGA